MGVAIVPPPTLSYRCDRDDRSLGRWVRGLLTGIVGGLVVVFAIAAWLNPYEADGTPRRLATHQQLGLPPCSFVQVTSLPCPACGMTTSFALLVRADLRGSLQANWVGTLLAGFCLLFIPWGTLSVLLGRAVFVRSLEKAFIAVLVTLLVLMLLRWLLVMAVCLYEGALLS